MNRLAITVLALTLATSCSKKDDAGGGGSQGGSPQPGGAPSAALTCAQVADRAVGGLGPGGGQVKERLRPIYEKRCTDDKWPAEAMECFAKAEGMPALKQCRERLPEIPKQNLLDQIRVAMSQAAGSGRGMRGHGSGDGPGSSGGSGSAPAPSGSGSGSDGSAKAPK